MHDTESGTKCPDFSLKKKCQQTGPEIHLFILKISTSGQVSFLFALAIPLTIHTFMLLTLIMLFGEDPGVVVT